MDVVGYRNQPLITDSLAIDTCHGAISMAHDQIAGGLIAAFIADRPMDMPERIERQAVRCNPAFFSSVRKASPIVLLFRLSGTYTPPRHVMKTRDECSATTGFGRFLKALRSSATVSGHSLHRRGMPVLDRGCFIEPPSRSTCSYFRFEQSALPYPQFNPSRMKHLSGLRCHVQQSASSAGSSIFEGPLV